MKSIRGLRYPVFIGVLVNMSLIKNLISVDNFLLLKYCAPNNQRIEDKKMNDVSV
jgi:hypothetical protein